MRLTEATLNRQAPGTVEVETAAEVGLPTGTPAIDVKAPFCVVLASNCTAALHVPES
jgi:hypothetical protein